MNRKRVFAGFLIGILTVQAAWIAAMPAFRGPDEFDHVFRAEGVSHGALMPGESISPYYARGALTPVRRSVIDAASAVCASYKYTRFYDCHARETVHGDWEHVGSGAARYNPAYYLVVGNIARFFDGVTVDYVIRAVTALMCALLLAWAAVLWVGLGWSRWRTLGLMSALTPVLIFSTTIAAPNGVSYAAAVLLWVAGLAMLRDPLAESARPAVPAVAVGAVVMCNTHTTGPLWLLLIAISWLILKPHEVGAALRQRRYWPLIAVVTAGVFASMGWTLASGANLPNPNGSITSSPELGPLVSNEFAWLFQTIAAFPLRNEMAPPIVYVLWLVGFGLLVVQGSRTSGRTRITVGWMIIGILTTQTALTYVGFKTDGYAWQGRYGLPFVVGLALIPGLIDRARGRLSAPVYHSALVAMALAVGISVQHVAHNERGFLQRPWTDYVHLGPSAAGLAAAVGTLIMAWSMRDQSSDPRVGTATGANAEFKTVGDLSE